MNPLLQQYYLAAHLNASPCILAAMPALRRLKLFAVLAMLLVMVYFGAMLSAHLVLKPKTSFSNNIISKFHHGRPRFAKVVIASGFEDIVYERALDTHRRYAQKHGYPIYIARENAAEGMFNKVAFLQVVLLDELYKPREERVEWLFYTDADTIVMNQEIPLSIFEPPGDFNHVKWIAGRDWNGLNAGIFFLRVDTWSLNLLNRVMTYKHYHPTEDYTFEEQSILARLTEQNDEFKTQAIYMPRMWFNAYVSYKEEHPGLFMAHFPDAGHKWHMYKWLRIAEVRNGLNRTSIDHMPLPYIPNLQEISNFWAARRRADEVLKQLEGIAVEQATIEVNHENIRLWGWHGLEMHKTNSPWQWKEKLMTTRIWPL